MSNLLFFKNEQDNIWSNIKKFKITESIFIKFEIGIKFLKCYLFTVKIFPTITDSYTF